jgi:hypothetical protein
MMIHRIMVVLSTAFLAGCTVFGVRSGTEEPTYTKIAQIGDDIEIRSYGSRLAAETEVEAVSEEAGRNAAFRLLFNYISGANRAAAKIAMTTPVSIDAGAQKIAMTAPVATATAGQGRYAMRFFLPASYTMETAPQPTDPRVRLAEVPAETLAVLRFSGSPTQTALAARKAELLGRLQTSDWRPVGDPVSFLYDPPWTLPFQRRNEVAVPVVAR